MTARHYIATDPGRNAIWGVGETEEAARLDALEWLGRRLDAEGEEIPEADTLAWLETAAATPALVAQVTTLGGKIAWGYLSDGTACSVEEEENGEAFNWA